MSLGATLAGLAFSNVGVALVHALEYPLGGLTHCSHGAGNGLFLPYVMRFNLPQRERELAQVADVLGCRHARVIRSPGRRGGDRARREAETGDRHSHAVARIGRDARAVADAGRKDLGDQAYPSSEPTPRDAGGFDIDFGVGSLMVETDKSPAGAGAIVVRSMTAEDFPAACQLLAELRRPRLRMKRGRECARLSSGT